MVEYDDREEQPLGRAYREVGEAVLEALNDASPKLWFDAGVLLASNERVKAAIRNADRMYRPPGWDETDGTLDYDRIERRIRSEIERGQKWFSADDVASLLFIIDEQRQELERGPRDDVPG